MRRSRFLLLFCLSIQSIYAQNITRIEYFIDNDTGYGNGIPVSFTQTDNVTVNFPINLSGSLTEGFHFLHIRAKDSDNRWSMVGGRPFYNKVVLNDTLTNIAVMEYFIDNDPGYGNGVSLNYTIGTNATQSFQVSIPSNLSDGFHFLSIRAKDAYYKWSVVGTRPFYKQNIPNNPLLNIVELEYFIDTDPGIGNATLVPIIAETSISRNFLLDLNNVSNGSHLLYIRAKDANNKWSQLSTRDFIVQDNIIIVQNMVSQWCPATNFDIPIVLYGTYTPGNVFTAQLSDATGSFASPTTIGTLTSTNAGTILANIPNTVNVGISYKIRVVSSNPVVDNSPFTPFELLSICPPPCAGILTLQSWNDDYLAGNVIKEANAINGTITATNQIRNYAKVTYRSGSSIILNPGFSVNNGAVFKTEFGGCN